MKNKNQIVFWVEGMDIKKGVLLGWGWTACECAVARVLTPYGQTLEILAEDIYLSHGAAMKEVTCLAGI